MKIIATSGYYNPLHSGHIALFREAKLAHPDANLVVIVNNDKQVALKGSVPFMSESERMEVVRTNKYVDAVMLSIDEDRSIQKTLAQLNPDIFLKGGDSTADNTPELAWCDENGVQIIFGVGGEKVQSSSWLIKAAAEKTPA
jgi:cytidyltransferase-like protein